MMGSWQDISNFGTGSQATRYCARLGNFWRQLERFIYSCGTKICHLYWNLSISHKKMDTIETCDQQLEPWISPQHNRPRIDLP